MPYLLFRFENALKAIDPEIVLPYWNSNLDSHLGDRADQSAVWSEDVLGTNHGNVNSGPYSDWVLVHPIKGQCFQLIIQSK